MRVEKRVEVVEENSKRGVERDVNPVGRRPETSTS